ncbi:MAG TPA: WYL domain-containing protein [Bacteroidia bacterium]|nr:WYL domain-containing protein [Bacteroidia bacterium]
MAKRDYILRYLTILKKLRNGRHASFEEIQTFLENESEISGNDMRVSLRTFQRDIQDILTIFHVEIKYDRLRKAYYIEEEEKPEINELMFEAFDLFNLMNIASNHSAYIQFEKRRPQGTQHFSGLLHAIKNNLIIVLTHIKFWNNEITSRELEPYLLKESQNRWYLVAYDINAEKIKTFGLDRIVSFEIIKKTFQPRIDLNINSHFKHCFGIISLENEPPEEIILSFDAEQGKYIKTYPIHESQIILKDDENEFRIQLKLQLTWDFLMEIMSFGSSVQVLSPIKLINMLKEEFQKSLALYSTENE